MFVGLLFLLFTPTLPLLLVWFVGGGRGILTSTNTSGRFLLWVGVKPLLVASDTQQVFITKQIVVKSFVLGEVV